MPNVLEIPMKGEYDVYDITHEISKYAKENNVQNGIIIVYSKDPLVRFITIEYDADLLLDFKKLLSEIAGDNRFLKASILSPSITIPVINGRLELGSFQQIVVLDLNEREGTRKICFLAVEY
ncbi:MAG: hypothetical protein DRJ44_03345 [Thermoprotei archaeon]|nr:MAG: hypothetical protein DRJ44_03345 [Thermoprotei archaeon]